MLKQLKWPHHTLFTTSWGWKKNKERGKNYFVPTVAHISQVQGSRTHLPSPGTLHMSFPNSLPYKDQAKSWEADRYRPARQRSWVPTYSHHVPSICSQTLKESSNLYLSSLSTVSDPLLCQGNLPSLQKYSFPLGCY